MQVKQILQAFNTWHKILEQMETNITSKTNTTSIQLITGGTQNPPSKVCLCTKSSNIVIFGGIGHPLKIKINEVK
jgi:hypothetical protein